jgi:hypothetical protein
LFDEHTFARGIEHTFDEHSFGEHTFVEQVFVPRTGDKYSFIWCSSIRC